MYIVYFGAVPFPLAPERIRTKISGRNETVDLLNEGQVNLLRAPGLTEFEFDLFIPHDRIPSGYYPKGFQKPEYFLTVFETLQTGKKPFQLIIMRKSGQSSLFNTNISVTLEEYEIDEDMEEGGDLIISVKLKQYRPFSAKQIKIDTSKGTGTTKKGRDASSSPSASSYTVKRGDSLWAIARTYLGNGARYKEIFNLNKDKIKNPSLIYPGQVFKLPKK